MFYIIRYKHRYKRNQSSNHIQQEIKHTQELLTLTRDFLYKGL